MSTAAVILAAGSSSRLGSPKQLARISGETLLERAVSIARESGCTPLIVVLGAYEDEIRRSTDLRDAMVLSNPDWSRGMGASIACGVAAAGDAPGLLITTCDMPAVTADHLRELMQSGETTASFYAGKRGVPAYFPRSAFGALLKLQGDAGARLLLESARVVPLPGGELDIDTPESLARAEQAHATPSQ